MSGAEVGRVELAERIKKVEEFVRRYQEALRALHAQLPSDDNAVPRSVAASLGRCDIWPCRDAAVVLTYADSSAVAAVSVKDSLDKGVSEFMKKGEVFTYYDDRGRAATLRVSFAPLEQDDPRYNPRIPPDNFSLRKINLNDVVAWAEDKNDAKGARVKKFFRPEFKKVSVYGWYAHLGDPEREALKDFRKAFVLANILGQDGEGLTEREKMQQAVSAADQYVAEFESLLDKAGPEERAKEFLKHRPGIVHPAQLRCYTEVPLGEDQTADLLLLVQEEEGLEYVFVKLGGADDVFFTDSGQHSEAFLIGKETISAWEEWLAQSQTHMSPSITEGSKVTIQLVIGRSSTLTYQQRKELRTADAGTGRSYCTYDDLVNRFRYVVNDVTSVWDRFEPVDARLKKVGINTEEEFGRLMEAIDQEMRDEQTPIRARSMEAVGKFTLGYSTSLMHKDPLTTKIHEWFDRRYGDRLKIDPTWKMAVQIRGDLYRLRLPLVFGAANVICSPEHYGTTSQTQAGIGGHLPTINVLDLIDDFTEEYAKSLTKDELAALFNQFQLGFAAMNEIDSISETELVKETIGDIDASVAHLFANQPQFGLSKWASLQATEKIIKAFISQKGEKYKTIHKLEELASHAELLGLNEIPRPLLDKVQCTPGVRYGNPDVSLSEAVAAHHVALDLCLGVANQIFLTHYFEQAKELEAGKYYTNSLRKEYRCIKVDDDKATIMLFDEVMGKPLEVQFVQDRKYWRQYYILPDHAPTSRLERRYQAIVAKDAASEKKDPAKSPIKVGRNDPCPCGSGKKYKKCCGN